MWEIVKVIRDKIGWGERMSKFKVGDLVKVKKGMDYCSSLLKGDKVFKVMRVHVTSAGECLEIQDISNEKSVDIF